MFSPYARPGLPTFRCRLRRPAGHVLQDSVTYGPTMVTALIMLATMMTAGQKKKTTRERSSSWKELHVDIVTGKLALGMGKFSVLTALQL